MSSNENTRRTKRRFAHELYPPAAEGEVRPLSVEVPYAYAHAMGLQVMGTSWFTSPPAESIHRTDALISTRMHAFMLDALHQGLFGQEAWDWAGAKSWDETGELAYDRARHYGVDPEAIKPYPCGPESDKHVHYQGRVGRYVDGKESECEDCTEPVPDVSMSESNGHQS